MVSTYHLLYWMDGNNHTSGYTEDEKVNIASKYLIEKQKKNNGLKEMNYYYKKP